MTIQPTANYFLCSVHEGKNLEAGLVLPENVELQPYAKVLAIGPDVKTLALGDLVLFHPSNAVFADTIDDQRIVIAPEGCVFAKYVEQIVPNN